MVHSWAALQIYVIMSTSPSHCFPAAPQAQLWVPLLLLAKPATKAVVCLGFVASECVGITVSPRGQTVF